MMIFRNMHRLKRHINHFFGHGQVLTVLLKKGPTAQSELFESIAGERPSVDDPSVDSMSLQFEKMFNFKVIVYWSSRYE
jgi:hypothetical protein